MNKNLKTLCLLLLLAVSSLYYSCETIELDNTQDPNALGLSAADPSLLLNGVQLNFAKMVEDFGTTGAEVSRLKYMFGRNYNNAYSAASFNNGWEYAYRDVIKNIRVMNPLAAEKGLTKHLGMGQVFEAYTLITLVDFFGDVPYSEAWIDSNLNPKLDSGASVYAAAIVLLDKAIVILQQVRLWCLQTIFIITKIGVSG